MVPMVSTRHSKTGDGLGGPRRVGFRSQMGFPFASISAMLAWFYRKPLQQLSYSELQARTSETT